MMFSLNGAEYQRNLNQFDVVFTNTTTVTFTNSQIATNAQDTGRSIYHTFQLFCTSTATNAVTANLDKTIDGSNWIPVSTNTVTTNGIVEYSVVGKWAQYRWRVTATTNATVVENYMSQ